MYSWPKDSDFVYLGSPLQTCSCRQQNVVGDSDKYNDDDNAGTVTSSVGHLSQTTMEELNRHDGLQASLSQFDLTRSEQVWTPSVAALKRRPEVNEWS